MGIGPTGTDILRHLRVPHGQALEQEAAVEVIGLLLQLLLDFVYAPFKLGSDNASARALRGQVFAQTNEYIML